MTTNGGAHIDKPRPPLLIQYCNDLGLSENQTRFMTSTEFWADNILAWIPSILPDFTDHGKLHSQNVLKNIHDIIHEYPRKFTENEKFLLVLSSKIHDIGCIYGRDNHEINSVKMVDEYFFPNMKEMGTELEIGLTNCLKQVIISHVSDYDFRQIIDYPPDDVNLKLICPLFRLADGLDLNTKRVSPALFDILSKNHRLNEISESIWKSHLSVQNVSIKCTEITMWINDFAYSGYCINKMYKEIDIINNFFIDNNFPRFTLKIRNEEINSY